jgi:hypothetical protein
MKKILCLSLAVLASYAAHAQTSRGSTIITKKGTYSGYSFSNPNASEPLVIIKTFDVVEFLHCTFITVPGQLVAVSVPNTVGADLIFMECNAYGQGSGSVFVQGLPFQMLQFIDGDNFYNWDSIAQQIGSPPN